MVPQTETNNADMYPPLPVGVGTKSKADPAIAPEAIATASGVAVPPPGRQNLKRRAMDAMARDAATEMPKIQRGLPQELLDCGVALVWCACAGLNGFPLEFDDLRVGGRIQP